MKIKALCQENSTRFFSFKDQLIFHKDEILSQQEKSYSVYTPFMKKWMKKFSEHMLKPYHSEYYLNKISSKKLPSVESLSEIGFHKTPYQLFPPQISESELIEYEHIRNLPIHDTSQLSVYLRFGFLSIREVVEIANKHSECLLRELIWRSFFSQILDYI